MSTFKPPVPSPDADSPVVRLYREWIDLETRINGAMPDEERDAIVVGEMSELEDRLEAQPAFDARDLAIKLYVLIEYYEGPIADEIDHLIATGELPSAQVDAVVADDPLLELVKAYRQNLAVFNASSPDMTLEEDDALRDATWGPPYEQLCVAPPVATTLEGAIEAIRLVRDEEHKCGNQPDLTINVLTAALAFFDEGRGLP